MNSAEEEEELRAQGFGTLAETGIITAPDAKEVQKRKAISASDWRAAAGVPANDITDDHVKFLQANGRPDIQSVGDVYTLLSKFTGAQMKAFLVDTQNWLQSQAKAKAKAKAN